MFTGSQESTSSFHEFPLPLSVIFPFSYLFFGFLELLAANKKENLLFKNRKKIENSAVVRKCERLPIEK